MKRLGFFIGALVLVCAAVSDAAAATKSAKCERYKEQLERIAEAEREGGSQKRLQKLTAKREKIHAAQVKRGC